MFVTEIAPRATKGLTRFPHHWLAVGVFEATRRLELLGGNEVADVGQIEAIVDQGVGLEFVHDGVQFLGFPIGVAGFLARSAALLRMGWILSTVNSG